MLKRFSAIFGLLFVLTLNIAFANCSFFTDSTECEIFSEPYNNFNFQFTEQTDLDDYEVEIFNKLNPSNFIRLEKDGNTARNINPFTEPGVYVVRVVARNKAQVPFTAEYEFIFNNRKPAAPVIPLDIKSDQSSLTIIGDARNSEKVYADVQSIGRFETTAGSDGSFSINIDLNPGVNYVKFFTENSAGLTSALTERAIIFDENFAYNADASGDVNVNLNLQTINEGTTQTGTHEYRTIKRNFYITGNVGVSGAKVYANGNPAISTSNGDYGMFVILNEGMNDIEVISKDFKQLIKVEYIPANYLFFPPNIPNRVDSTSLQFEMSANLDLPFNVYVNGEFIETTQTESGTKTLSISGLNSGKNHIFIEGFNGQQFTKLVYVDQELPSAKILSNQNIANPDRFYFELKDDTGIDLNTIKVDIGDLEFTGSDVTVEGDIYSIDISNLENSLYSYTVFASDYLGNPILESGNLNVNQDNVLIEDVEGARLIGNRLYVGKGPKTLILKPSQFIAFNSIYLDDVRQTSYEIKTNKDVEINLEFEEGTGQIEFSYIDFNRNQFVQTFEYFTDDENPVVELDYIDSSQTGPGNTIEITGRIIDSHFNWDTFNVGDGVSSSNGAPANYKRYGEYFEASFDPSVIGSSNVKVSGEDFSGNAIFPNSVSVFLDDDSSQISFIDTENSISGAIINSQNRIMNFLSSYDGTYLQSTPLAPIFDIAAEQRHGLRSVNMKGHESSGIRFSNIDIVAPGDPESLNDYNGNRDIPLSIYLTGNDFITNRGDHFIQGQVIADSPILFVKTQDVYCVFDEYNFVCPAILLDETNNFTIYVGTQGNESGDPPIDPITNSTNTTINTTNPCEDPLECVPDPIVCPADPRCPTNPECPGPNCPPVCPGPDPRCPVDEICPNPNNPNCPDDPICPDSSNPLCPNTCPDPTNPVCTKQCTPPSVAACLNAPCLNPDDYVCIIDDSCPDSTNPNCPGTCPDSTNPVCDPVCPDPNNPQCPDICTNPAGCDPPECPDPGNLKCAPVCPDPLEPRCNGCSDPNGCEPNCPDPTNPQCDNGGENNDLNVAIMEILTRNGVYKISDQYFATVEEMDARSNVSERAAITLIIDGSEVPIGERNGIFTVDVDLSDQVAGKTQDEIDLQLKAEDELGNEARSNIVKVFYSRVIETLVEVFVG